MRTILFRGKRTNNGEWVEGGIAINGNDVYITQGAFYFQVIPETVGQFTGLLDKGGKKIFDGDIVRFTTDHDVYDGTGSKMKVKVTFASPVVWQEFRA